jgi:hypothetical protein
MERKKQVVLVLTSHSTVPKSLSPLCAPVTPQLTRITNINRSNLRKLLSFNASIYVQGLAHISLHNLSVISVSMPTNRHSLPVVRNITVSCYAYLDQKSSKQKSAGVSIIQAMPLFLQFLTTKNHKTE